MNNVKNNIRDETNLLRFAFINPRITNILVQMINGIKIAYITVDSSFLVFESFERDINVKHLGESS